MSFIILSSWVVTWCCQTVTVALRHLRRDSCCRFWFCSGRCQLLTPTQTEAAGAFLDEMKSDDGGGAAHKHCQTHFWGICTVTLRQFPSSTRSVVVSRLCGEKIRSHCDEKDLLVHIKVSTESPCYLWKRQNVNTREKSLMGPIIFSFFSHSSQRES